MVLGVTVYCTFFNNNSLPPRKFLCNKKLLKKIATVRGMHIEQIFELGGPGLPIVYVLLQLVVFMTKQ